MHLFVGCFCALLQDSLRRKGLPVFQLTGFFHMPILTISVFLAPSALHPSLSSWPPPHILLFLSLHHTLSCHTSMELGRLTMTWWNSHSDPQVMVSVLGVLFVLFPWLLLFYYFPEDQRYPKVITPSVYPQVIRNSGREIRFLFVIRYVTPVKCKGLFLCFLNYKLNWLCRLLTK